MNDDPDDLNRFVEDLLQDRKPERTPLPDEDALRARQTAAMLRAASPGAGLPTNAFLERIHRWIREWIGEKPSPARPEPRPSRRALLLTGTASLAAGLAAALGIDRWLKPSTPSSGMALVETGSWKSVMPLANLADGTPTAFRSGAIEGFVIRRGSGVRALSAICTHMGCILNYSKFRDRFECPCHGATFGTDGQPTNLYDDSLPPLPALKVRVQGGQVDVYTV